MDKNRELVGVIKLFTIYIGLIMTMQSKGNLEIRISGIKKKSGVIRIAIWKDGVGYPDKESLMYRNKVIAVDDIEITTIFEDLEFGEYAFTTFHDVNNNGKLDKNIFGYPTEPFAFSNNVKPGFGPPPYELAKFKIDKAQTLIQNIKLL